MTKFAKFDCCLYNPGENFEEKDYQSLSFCLLYEMTKFFSLSPPR